MLRSDVGVTTTYRGACSLTSKRNKPKEEKKVLFISTHLPSHGPFCPTFMSASYFSWQLRHEWAVFVFGCETCPVCNISWDYRPPLIDRYYRAFKTSHVLKECFFCWYPQARAQLYRTKQSTSTWKTICMDKWIWTDIVVAALLKLLFLRMCWKQLGIMSALCQCCDLTPWWSSSALQLCFASL